MNKKEIVKIKNVSPTNTYMRGGGQLAGWLLKNGLVVQLKIKSNPITPGGGISLFG